MNLRIVIALVVLLVVVVLGAVLIAWPTSQNTSTTPPPTPSTQQQFTSENVRVSSPLPSAIVGKTFRVAGEARGPWYFEANLPLLVKDVNGSTVGNGSATAQGEWMTTDFVPFEGKITVDVLFSGPAKLVIMKDNPSGLPENNDSVEFPIVVQ